MSGKKQREKLRANYRKAVSDLRICPNCLKQGTGGCYVPPCFGDPGFFVCEPATEEATPNASR